jgi:hypothetical protein
VLSLVLADFVDGDDVRVRQVGRRLRLQAEALDGSRRRQPAADDRLQRHEAIEGDLARLEDDAHPAAGNLTEQLVIAEATRLARAGTSCYGRGVRNRDPRAGVGNVQDGSFEERASLAVRREQRLHLAAQVVVSVGRRTHERRSFRHLSFEGGEEDVGDESPACRVHLEALRASHGGSGGPGGRYHKER